MMTLLLRWAVYLLTLAGLCAFAVNYTAWFSSFLFYAVLLLPPFSLLLSLWPYVTQQLSFSAPMQVHRGDFADLKITVKGRGCPYYLPLLLTESMKMQTAVFIKRKGQYIVNHLAQLGWVQFHNE